MTFQRMFIVRGDRAGDQCTFAAAHSADDAGAFGLRRRVGRRRGQPTGPGSAADGLAGLARGCRNRRSGRQARAGRGPCVDNAPDCMRACA
jgi:hypothetical protein